jgi:hypothetical protein
MEIGEYIGDLILVAILVISTLVFITRLSQDPIVAAGAGVMMLSLGGLFLVMHSRIRRVERGMGARERVMKTNLEEISSKMAKKYDSAIAHFDGILEELSKRVYR